MPTKPHTRNVSVPVEVFKKYEAAARLVAESSPLMQAVPLAKLTQMLLQVELDGSSPEDIAKRFVRNIVRQVRLDEPAKPSTSVPHSPSVSAPSATS